MASSDGAGDMRQVGTEFGRCDRLREAIERTAGVDAAVLSGGEYARAQVLAVLVEHFDRLDGVDQTAIVEALSTVAASTVAAEQRALRVIARAGTSQG